jgi:hypothetical protein
MPTVGAPRSRHLDAAHDSGREQEACCVGAQCHGRPAAARTRLPQGDLASAQSLYQRMLSLARLDMVIGGYMARSSDRDSVPARDVNDDPITRGDRTSSQVHTLDWDGQTGRHTSTRATTPTQPARAERPLSMGLPAPSRRGDSNPRPHHYERFR